VNPRRANLLTALGLVTLLAAVAATAPLWARFLSRAIQGPDGEGSSAGPGGSREEEGARPAERRINVKLFFQSGDRQGLLMEERAVAFAPELGLQIRAVVEELVRGPRSGLLPTLPPGTRVLEVFVTARGVAYVDLSREAAEGHPGGSEAERISVYSVVNSLTANFPAVKRVQILVEDRPALTLAGHVDLTRPLPPDMTLLAASTLTPGAAPP
jgi:germination protein M